jgi:hypothetical protein
MNYGSLLTNHGTINLLGGEFSVRSSPGFISTIYNETNGVIDIQGDYDIGFGTLINRGTIRKSSGTNTTTLLMTLENPGTIEMLAGNLEVGRYYFAPFQMLPTSILRFQIRGRTPGVDFGYLTVPSAMRWAGSVQVEFTNSPPLADDSFRLINCPSHSGLFQDINATGLSTIAPSLYWTPSGEPQGLTIGIYTTNAPPTPPRTNLFNQTVAFGQESTFVIEPIAENPTYQWQLDGTNLASETGSYLTLSNVQTTNIYSVVVADALLRTNIYQAELRPLQPPYFTSVPTSQSLTNGASTTLAAGVGGDPPFTYQWLLNGTPIPGATTPSYAIPSATAADGGKYSLQVANSVGLTSTPPAIIVVECPALFMSDNFSNAPPTNTVSFVGAATNSSATFESGELEHGDCGTNSVWLRWTPPFVGVGQVSTRGSMFDTLLGVYSDFTNGPTTVSDRTVVRRDDDSAGGLTSRAYFNAQAGSNYWIAVAGFRSQGGRLILSGSLDTNITDLPRIYSQPGSAVATNGGSAIYNVFAASTNTLLYQWSFNDCLAVAGGTNATLTLTNVGFNNVGLYRVEVSTPSGAAIQSDAARLELGNYAESTSDKLSCSRFFGPSSLGPQLLAAFPSVSVGSLGSQTFSTFGSTSDPTEPAISDTIMGGPTRWYQLTATADGTLVADTVGSQFDTLLGLFTGSDVFTMTRLASDSSGHNSLVRVEAKAGNTYLVGVSGVNGASGTIVLNWRLGVAPNTNGPAQNLIVTNGVILLMQSGVSTNVTAPTYQWRRNGFNITGATNSTYTIASLQSDQVGSYSVAVSNLVGQVINSIAVVSAQSPLTLMRDTNSVVRVSGSATQATVLQLSTNLSLWFPVYTNPTPLLPVSFLDTSSSLRPSGFYRLKPWP